jgi:hypothetical protein
MIPEAELIRKDFTLREIDFPESVSLTKNSLLRWCALSLGLISKNESRDKAFLVLDALFTLLFTKKQNPTTIDIQAQIKSKTKADMSEKLIRFHLNKLIELNLLGRKNNKYYINPSPNSEKRDSLSESYSAWVEKQVEKEMEKTKKALEKLQEKYAK